MSIFAAVLLAAAVVLVAAAQWPKLAIRAPRLDRRKRASRRRTKLRVVEPEHDDDFVRAVERDLAALPTIDEQDAKKKR